MPNPSLFDKARRMGKSTAEIMADLTRGVSPVSGKRLPTIPPTAAQVSAQILNWRRLLIKGAIGHLRKVASEVGLWEELNPALTCIEQQLGDKALELHNNTKAK